MQHIKFIFWLLPSIFFPNNMNKNLDKNSVLFCYGKLKANNVKNYKYVVLESLNFSSKEIKDIKQNNNKNVLSYISLGEVNSNAIHYNKLKNSTLGKNSNWDSYYLNLKDKKTREVLIQLIKDNLNKGFDGMFLDNIDNFTQFGPQKDDKYELISFLKSLKKMFPNKVFIQNAGLELLDQTHKQIDGVVLESVATSYSFKDNKYQLKDKKSFDIYIKKILAYKQKYNIKFIFIEYADSKSLYDKVTKRLLKYNIDYFIGKIDLQTIPNYLK